MNKKIETLENIIKANEQWVNQNSNVKPKPKKLSKHHPWRNGSKKNRGVPLWQLQ